MPIGMVIAIKFSQPKLSSFILIDEENNNWKMLPNRPNLIINLFFIQKI